MHGVRADARLGPSLEERGGSVAYCANCGEELPDAARFCPSCGHPAGEVADRVEVSETGLPLAERERILNAEIRRFTKKGYQLRHQTSTTAQMVLPKPPSTAGTSCLLVLLTFGLWLIVEAVRLIIQPVKKEEALFIQVLLDGTVERTTEGWLGGTVQDKRYVPKGR